MRLKGKSLWPVSAERSDKPQTEPKKKKDETSIKVDELANRKRAIGNPKLERLWRQ